MKQALSIPSRKVWEGLLATQKEFLEHANPSNVDGLAKFVLLDEKELGSEVAEIGENIEKLICHDIPSHLGNEAVLPKDIGTKGILKVILTSSNIYFINNSNLFNNELLLLFQSLYMLQLSAVLKRKVLLLEKEAWGNLSASLAGTKTSV